MKSPMVNQKEKYKDKLGEKHKTRQALEISTQLVGTGDQKQIAVY